MESDAENFLFDDCSICREQKKALTENRNLSYDELQAAFRAADDKHEKARNTAEPKDPIAVEKTLRSLIQKYNLGKKLSVAAIKERIYKEDGESAMEASNKYQLWWTRFFKKQFESGSSDVDLILEAFTDAWNYFPHKSLGGKSPYEKYRGYDKQAPPTSFQDVRSHNMPRVHVGNAEMSWNEYQRMLGMMEKEQEPLKRLIGQILSSYKVHLEKEEKLSKKTVEKHWGVADMFFERALHVGFVDFADIRKAFVTKEFPRWWQTHVMFFTLRESEIVASLKKLFAFIKMKHGLAHAAFRSKA